MEMLVDYYNGGVSGYKKAVTDLIIEKYDKIRDDPRELDYSLTQDKRLPYWYLISRVFNFAFFAIVKKSRN